ncbi:hypothetical protein [Methylobacterium brachiatum]|uniref:hypothetical protein n=1 Tax=Methylobacterium brachiatum TaxID=269660 RepID=UPI00244D105D|nr:hypothetical protein [Methylobacterium brachiatum]MDH2310798.1 hypothetical protein [Methylobacterium brachiatum]
MRRRACGAPAEPLRCRVGGDGHEGVLDLASEPVGERRGQGGAGRQFGLPERLVRHGPVDEVLGGEDSVLAALLGGAANGLDFGAHLCGCCLERRALGHR